MFIARRLYRSKWALLLIIIATIVVIILINSQEEAVEPSGITSYGEFSNLSPHFPRYLTRTRILLPLRLIIIVISRFDHFENRKSIRKTWANIDKLGVIFGKNLIRGPFFIIGNTFPSYIEHMITREKQTHNDIVTVNATDEFAELTPKMLETFRWIYENEKKWSDQDLYLSTANDGYYILKTDDDVYIDLYRLFLPIYGRMRSQQMTETVDKFIYGRVMRNAKVIRDSNDKLFVSRSTYPFSRYPPYCSGITYIFDSKMLPEMLDMANRLPLLPNEDTFFTGTLAVALEMQHFHLPVVVYHYEAGTWNEDDLCKAGNGSDESRVVIHRLSPFEMIKVDLCSKFKFV